MECKNCGTINEIGANFCASCGGTIKNEEVVANGNYMQNTNNQMAWSNNTPNVVNNTNMGPNVVSNVNTGTKKNNNWFKIGAIVVVVVLIVIYLFGSDSSISSVNNSARSKFGEYLSNNGFTENSSTNYTMYNDGFLITIDFDEELMSMESSDNTMYSAYYYKDDIAGVASENGSLKIVTTYNLITYDYQCEVEPSTYESYSCSYVKSTFIELATTMKKTFNILASNAGVSPSDL